MKTFNAIFTGLTILAISAFTIKDNAGKGLKPGDKAPLTDTEMTATDGAKYTLEKLKGTNGLLVIFSCNTCPFVVGSESFKGWEVQYNDLHEAAKKSGFGMILVNSNAAKRGDDDSMEKMTARAKDKVYTMPYVADENSVLANAFGAKTTPHVYLFNEKMELLYTGAIDNSVEAKRDKELNYLTDAMAQKAKGEKIAVTSTPPRGCSIKRAQ